MFGICSFFTWRIIIIMKFKKFIQDKIFDIAVSFFINIMILFLLIAFKSNISLIIATELILIILPVVLLVRDFFRRKKFYDELISNVERLDKKYLVMEMINRPDFYEGEIFEQVFYEINKSMIENVKQYENSMNDFKDYIEMWVHEVKIPIASLLLMCHNNKGVIEKKYVKQIKKMDNYTDQVLYYVRGENAENDYIIKEIDLNNIISKVAIKNKDDILENDILLQVDNVNRKVLTDSKWLEFIINQLVNNSIKYRRNSVESHIHIFSEENQKNVKIIVEDNGMGISVSDLPNVYKKTFTGENGRIHAKSTGMGLYIVKNLIDRLGHRIEITSKQGEYTRVTIIINKNDFYKFN